MAFASERKASKSSVPEDGTFDAELSRKIDEFIRMSDQEEEARRQSDRLGGNLYYTRHWNVRLPKNRAAITANLAKSLIDHKIAIMTKQRPLPVVEPDDVGDVEGARLMRSVLQSYWIADEMQAKSRDALRLANTTRTIAAKTYWDPELNGGAGGITTDIIPGYRLLLDNRARRETRMEFAGDRAYMPRSRAMKLYPESADKIAESLLRRNNITSKGSSESPLATPWKKHGVDSPSSQGGLVNGKPIITAFTGRDVERSPAPAMVEIIEMYHIDRTLVEKEVEVKDSLGNPQMRMITDEQGMPLFEQAGDFDDILGEQGWQLRYESLKRVELVPKYPYYRRTTKIMPDNQTLEDIAWDCPLPYTLYSDQEPLEGPWGKGCILEVEDLQALANVSLSIMADNLRFSSYRAFKATSQATIEKNNLVISPGDILRVGPSQDGLMPLEFPELSDAWFKWITLIISLMERIIGATGIMQGEAAGRVDSAQGYDMLAEIGGSRIVECTQRFETWIGRICEKVGWYAQRYYTEKHAIKVEDHQGEVTWERAASAQLMGSFSYRVVTGSTLAWNESSKRARVLEEFAQGLRDKISVWQNLHIEDWQMIKKRMEQQGPQFNPPPPARTRQSFGSKGRKNAQPNH